MAGLGIGAAGLGGDEAAGGDASASANAGAPPLSSLENLLGNIQNLLKVAAESVRHEEKQWIREKGEWMGGGG